MTPDDGPGLVVWRGRYDDVQSQRLIADVQAEYVIRYGGPDGAPVDPEEFVPPRGVFLLGALPDDPDVAIAMGGLRSHGDGVVEVKRMYVAREVRGRGLSRDMLAALEVAAVSLGAHRVVLETGLRQPEALRLYRGAGYVDVPAFGHYAHEPLSVHLGKEVGTGQVSG